MKGLVAFMSGSTFTILSPASRVFSEFEKKLYREAVIKGIIVYFGAIAGLLILQLAKI